MIEEGENREQCLYQNARPFKIFLTQIQKQFNKKFYALFLSPDIIKEIIQECQKRYLNQNWAKDVLSLLIGFMNYCRGNPVKIQNELANFTQNYAEELASRWKKIKEQIYWYSKSHLNLLNQIIAKDSFLQTLQFDMSLEKVEKVVEKVKEMCLQDIRAFCYLTNYFFNCCTKLSENGMSPLQIEEKYNIILKAICKNYPPAQEIYLTAQQQAQIKKFKTFILKDNQSKIPLGYSIIKLKGLDKKYRKPKVYNYIIERLEMAENTLQKFNLLFLPICTKWNGFYFKSGVKKNNSNGDDPSLTRIIQKLYRSNNKEIKQAEKRVLFSHGYVNIKSYTQQEISEHNKRMDNFFSQNDQLLFKISDLLRGKCQFNKKEDILKCYQEIKEIRDIGKLEFENRFQKPTSDFVIKVLIDGTVAQLQLVLGSNTSNYEFAHKLYELNRSNTLSPLTSLRLVNQQISRDYFCQVNSMILANYDCRQDDYNEQLNFQEAFKHFPKIAAGLKLDFNYLQKHPKQINWEKMNDMEKSFNAIVQGTVRYFSQPRKRENQLHLNNGIYYYQLGNYRNYQKALNELNQFCKYLSDEEKLNMFVNAYYSQIEERLCVNKHIVGLSYISKIYMKMEKYQDSRKYLQKQLCLRKRLINGNQALQTAQVIRKIGVAHSKQKNFDQAIEQINKSLNYQNQASEINKIEMSSTLTDRGEAYQNKYRYQKMTQIIQSLINRQYIENKDNAETAFQQYKLAQEQEAKISSNNTLTMARILIRKGVITQQAEINKQQSAISLFQRAIIIIQKIKGKGAIEAVQPLMYIGKIKCKAQKSKGAIAQYKRAKDICDRFGVEDQKYCTLLKLLGQAQRKQNQYNQAISSFEESIRISKNKQVRNQSLRQLYSLIYDEFRLKVQQFRLKYGYIIESLLNI